MKNHGIPFLKIVEIHRIVKEFWKSRKLVILKEQVIYQYLSPIYNKEPGAYLTISRIIIENSIISMKVFNVKFTSNVLGVVCKCFWKVFQGFCQFFLTRSSHYATEVTLPLGFHQPSDKILWSCSFCVFQVLISYIV